MPDLGLRHRINSIAPANASGAMRNDDISRNHNLADLGNFNQHPAAGARPAAFD